jgi:hypothetical protein
MPFPSKKKIYFSQIKRKYEQGMSVAEACEGLPVHYNTVCQWFAEEGIEIRKARTHRREKNVFFYQCDYCGSDFESNRADRRFCSRDCTNTWQREQGKGAWEQFECPCGTSFNRRKSTTQKFCSRACTHLYQDRRPKDPANYVTFECETCGKEMTRYKSYGKGANRFCSNECAQKFTKAVQHIGVNGVLLDSSWEAFFWGLCKLLQIPIERVDRAQAVEWKPGCWYAPDFEIAGAWVEVKGLEDDDDPEKWDAWRAHRGDLMVVDYNGLDTLRQLDREGFLCALGVSPAKV